VTMVVSDDPNMVEAALAAGRFACGCGSRLAPWGYGRTRSLRGTGGPPRRQRPRRARCTACGTTTVLLANWSLPRRRDTIEVIGAALLAHAHGVGHRPIAKRLGVPEGTVRGWLRRVRKNAEGLRVWATVIAHDCDPLLHPIRPTGSAIGDAVEALGTAVVAIKLRLGGDSGGWPTIVEFTRGRLLATRSL
jgi:transposase-like protein